MSARDDLIAVAFEAAHPALHADVAAIVDAVLADKGLVLEVWGAELRPDVRCPKSRRVFEVTR